MRGAFSRMATAAAAALAIASVGACAGSGDTNRRTTGEGSTDRGPQSAGNVTDTSTAGTTGGATGTTGGTTGTTGDTTGMSRDTSRSRSGTAPR
jgi:hypothetical protein